MVVRILKTTPPTWLDWSDRFVRGGLAVSSPTRVDHGLGGTTPSARLHRRGPRRGRAKFAVPIRPAFQLIRPHGSPFLSTREGEAYKVDLARSESRVVARTLSRLVTHLGGWPHWRVQRKIRAVATRWLQLAPPVQRGGIHVGFPCVELTHRRGELHTRWAAFSQRLIHLQGFRSRWALEFTPDRNHHLLGRRRAWSALAQPWIGRAPTGLAGWFRCIRRNYRCQRRQLFRVRRQRRYLRWRRRLPRQVSRPRRRRWWARRLRLQRFGSFVGARGWTRSRLVRAQSNRWSRLEEVALVRPDSSYLERLHSWSTRGIGRRVGTPWEYTYVKSFGFYSAFTTRRTYRGKRWKLQDHPSARVSFVEGRQQRWSWFTEGAVSQAVANLKGRLNPAAHPVGGGVESAVYWSTQEWGRGSRWKTKPLRRGLASFVRGLRSGWGVEPEAVQWSQAGTSAAGVRYSLLGEYEMPRPELEPSMLFQPGMVEAKFSPPPRWTFAVEALWFGLATPLWQLYRLAARGWSFVWFLCLVGTRLVYQVVVVPLVVVRAWVSPGWRWWCHYVRTTLVDHPRWRTVRWVYLAWLLAYSSEDNQYELERHSPDEEDGDYYEVLEGDPSGEAGEDADELGANSFRHRYPPWWGGWFEREVDSFYDEGRELAWTILVEEIPYYARLLAHPVVDFFFRLPFWGLAEGILALVAAAGRDLQRGWVDWLSQPGWTRPAALLGLGLVRWAGWFGLFWWIQSQLGYGALKFWMTYSVGITFHEEYYLGWLVFCGVLSAGVIAPRGIRRFFRVELGMTNLAFLWAAFTGLTFPEEYYPTRPTPQIRAWVHDRSFLVYHKLMVHPDGTERLYPHGAVTQPDWNDQVWAQLRGWNEPVREHDLENGPFGLQFYLPHGDEPTRPGWYPHLEPPGWGVDPRRTNVYEVEFGGGMGPHYPGSTPRRDHTEFTRSEDL